jgi:galactosamine-6-phosphate isomerase
VETQVLKTYEALSRTAADVLVTAVRDNPQASIIIATGSTPTLTYRLWIHDLLAQSIPVDQITIIKLDEWGGLPMHHPSTCETYIQTHILKPLHLRDEQYVSFSSQPEHPEVECQRIASALSHLVAIDVCVLGIGKNGHLGFNEPSDHWSTGPFVTTLSRESLGHDMLQGDSSQVTFGITLGMDNIRSAKKILVLASGEAKAGIVAAALLGPVTPQCPASLMQTLPNAQVILDTAAASQMAKT